MGDTPENGKTSAASPAGAGPLEGLRRFTAARIGLPRSGASLATGPLLDFRLAHARARDAVHDELDSARLAAEVTPLGLPVLQVASAADTQQSYLTRPDLGRRLADAATRTLQAATGERTFDAVFVVADGLSARAVQAHAASLLALTVPELARDGWDLAPFAIVRHGRVAIGDAIAGILRANLAIVLIGERPGLSAPDSMGAYLTWQPSPATTDAERNCISNIRPDGIPYADAAFKLLHLMRAMRAQKLSGVRLKDDSERLLIEQR